MQEFSFWSNLQDNLGGGTLGSAQQEHRVSDPGKVYYCSGVLGNTWDVNEALSSLCSLNIVYSSSETIS